MSIPIIDDQEKSAHDLCYGRSTSELKDAAWEIFERLVGSYSRANPELADKRLWAMGEVVCYSYALVFAAHSILNIDLPLVLDAPFGVLDLQRREKLADYLDSLSGQQIMLMSPYLSQGYEADYRLPGRVVPFIKL